MKIWKFVRENMPKQFSKKLDGAAEPSDQQPEQSEHLADKNAQQQTTTDMDNEIGAFEGPGLGWPVARIDQEGHQRNRPSGRAGRAVEQVGTE